MGVQYNFGGPGQAFALPSAAVTLLRTRKTDVPAQKMTVGATDSRTGSKVLKESNAIKMGTEQHNQIHQFQHQLNDIQTKYESQLQKLTEKCEELERNLNNKQAPVLFQRQESFDVGIQTDKEKRDASCQSSRDDCTPQLISIAAFHQQEPSNNPAKNSNVNNLNNLQGDTNSDPKYSQTSNMSTTTAQVSNVVEPSKNHSHIRNISTSMVQESNIVEPSNNHDVIVLQKGKENDCESKINFAFNDLVLDNGFVPWRRPEIDQVPVKLPSIQISGTKTVNNKSKGRNTNNNYKGDIALITTIRGLQSELESAKQEIRRLKLKESGRKPTNVDRWKGVIKATVGTQTIGLAASTSAHYNPAIFSVHKATITENKMLKSKLGKLEEDLQALCVKRTDDLKRLQEKHEEEMFHMIKEREVLHAKLDAALLRLSSG